LTVAGLFPLTRRANPGPRHSERSNPSPAFGREPFGKRGPEEFRPRGEESPSSQLRVPGFPYTPILFLLLTAFMLALLASRSPRQALLGLLVVSLGVPAFQLVRKGKIARAKG
jgi:hypothetical protein